MSLEILKNDIKKGTLQQEYLFYGPEIYLINYYLKDICDKLVNPNFKGFNYIVLEGKECINSIIVNCETLPMMDDKKLIIIKDSGLFSSNAKGKNEKQSNNLQNEIAEYLKNKLPFGVYIIFVEQEISKSNILFKEINRQGLAVEFNYIGVDELIKWVVKILSSYNIRIGKNEASHLLSLCNPGMTDILIEVIKLADYIGQNGIVKVEDIEEVCIKSLQGKVFEMIDAITQKNPSKAYKLLHDMLILKEPLQKISVLVARHFRLMFFIKQMRTKGYLTESIAKHLSIQAFIVNKYIKQCEKYKEEILGQAINDCLDMDIKLKAGRIDPRIALEMLIAKYST